MIEPTGRSGFRTPRIRHEAERPLDRAPPIGERLRRLDGLPEARLPEARLPERADQRARSERPRER